MERANPIALIFALFAMLVLFGGAGWLKDGIYLAKHEGDALHFHEIVLRMAQGQRPHLDFMTPIGAMAFKPIVWFIDADTGPGRALVLAQVMILLALFPVVWWIGVTRLTTIQAVCLGLVTTVLVTAFVHGEPEPTLSVSMHYNRWAWAVASLVIATAILPASDLHVPAVDGAIIGVGLALILLTKVTYAAGFGPAVLVALIIRREWMALAAAVLCGLAALGLYTAVNGVPYWLAYLQDILAVTGSENRSFPSLSVREVIAAPAYLGGSLILLASVIFLRQARRSGAGLILLLLAPGFIFVTYQNFGNDPQWLYFLPILLFALRPGGEVYNGLGWDMRKAITLAAVIAMALAAPSFLNLVYSPFRHLSADTAKYKPLLRDDPVLGDVYTITARAYAAGHARTVTHPGAPMEAYAVELDEPRKPTEIAGEILPICELTSGLVAYIDVIAKDLEAAGFGGSSVMVADVFSTIYWLYGDFKALHRGAPWSYGTAAGLEDADYFLVPFCPLHPHTQLQIVDAVQDRPEFTLTEIRRTRLYILFRVSRA